MNCLEFRHACLVDPLTRAPTFHDHAGQCPACQAFLQEQLTQEQRLRAALAIQPPAELAARILLRQSFVRRTRVPLALAATLLVSITAGLTGLFLSHPASLEAEVLAHVRSEPDHLTSAKSENQDKITTVLHTLGARFEGDPGDVRYAGICDIGNRTGGHLVLRGEHGPVSVFLLPNRKTTQIQRLQDRDLHTVVLPLDGGSIALVGANDENLERLSQRLRMRFHDPRV